MSLIAHENSCPEMKYLAEFVIAHSAIKDGRSFVFGLQMSNARIVHIVEAAQHPDQADKG